MASEVQDALNLPATVRRDIQKAKFLNTVF